MFALGSTHPVISENSLYFIRKMNGSAQSLLVRDAESKLWVLKPRSHLQGPNALANELLGAKLCRALGLTVPDCKLMRVAEGFAEAESWLDSPRGKAPIQAGLHFASRYIPNATGTDAYELIPPTLAAAIQGQSQCLGMLIFDVWAIHTDRRQALFTLEGPKLFPTFFDNSHLFGGPNWQSTKPHVYPTLLQKIALKRHRESHETEEWVTRMQEVIPPLFERVVKQTPGEWFEGDIQAISARFLKRLKELPFLLQPALAEIECCLRNAKTYEADHAGFDFRILSDGGTERWA